MQGKPFDMVSLELSLKSNPKTTSAENSLSFSKKTSPLSKLCRIITPFVDNENADQNTFFVCLLLLAEECFFDDYTRELHVDILLRLNRALDNILSLPSNFTHKLEREWLPQLAEHKLLLKHYNRRPRSLEAVPSYDPSAPMRMSLTPRESILSPKRKVDSPRREQQPVSSPVKEMVKMKRFWQDDEILDQKKDDFQGPSLDP